MRLFFFVCVYFFLSISEIFREPVAGHDIDFLHEDEEKGKIYSSVRLENEGNAIKNCCVFIPFSFILKILLNIP